MREKLRSDWQCRSLICTDRWGLAGLDWLPGVGTARVARCDSQWGPSVLKISIEPGMVGLEAKALRHFGAEICPDVYKIDEELEAVLMERIDFKEDLSALYPDPEQEVAVWLPIYDRIVRNPETPEGFPTLEKYGEVFDRVLAKPMTERFARIMRIARDRRGVLMGNSGENRLLHGDLHHFNLLHENTDRWRMIDPHGVVGHPHYELGAFLRNPWGVCYAEPGVFDRLSQRVHLLADRMGLPSEVVAQFGFYGAAFSLAWTLEEDAPGDVTGMAVMSEACLNLL